MREFWEIIGAVGLADILDIAFVASLLYLFLLWFKRTKAVFVATGIFILAAVYIIARQAGMVLTAWILQGFFAIFLIALVVIFQEELRSFFERLAVWSLGRRGSNPLQPKEVEILLHTIAVLTREKTGALIVLKGRDPLERHVEGGIELDGKLSGPLLLSIFDKHSEGHDGALVIERDRVSRFATHLPLSKDFPKVANLGTRHTAALGLSERSDALCIVVSEEKGSIAVARDGAIFQVRDLLALEGQIADFLKEKSPAPDEARRIASWRRNPFEKTVAASFAIALWLMFVQGFKPARLTYTASVEALNLAENMELESVQPPQVQVTLAGLKRDFYLLDPQGLKVTVDLDAVPEGTRRLSVSDQGLRLPKELRLVALDPPYVEVRLSRAPTGRGAVLRSLGFDRNPRAQP